MRFHLSSPLRGMAKPFHASRVRFPALTLLALLSLMIPARSQAQTSVSGTVNLQGVASGSLAQPLTFAFQPTAGGRAFVQTQTPAAADGSFTLTNIPAGSYNLFVKGSKWLQKLVAVDTTGGSVTGVTVPLLGGDLNGDNTVSGQDLGILRAAYGTSQGDAGYNPLADLNGDDTVSGQDLGILRSNYGLSGDAPAAATVSGVTSGVGNGCAVLAWTPTAGVTGYNVYRSTISGSGYTKVSANQTTPCYVDLSVTNGTTYYYLVTSLAGGVESFDSAQVTAQPNATGGTLVTATTLGSVTPGTTTATGANGTVYTTTLSNSGSNFVVQVSFNFAGSIAAPTNFLATPRNSEVVLQWDASDGATGYNLYRATSPGGPYVRVLSNYIYDDSNQYDATYDKNFYVYTDTELTNGTTYYYGLAAVGPGGESTEALANGGPNGSPGWVQLHREHTRGDVVGDSDYDMTGLYVTEFRGGGQSVPLGYPFYFGEENELIDDFPTPNATGETLSGTSTYTWEWRPPANPTGLHNDPTKAVNDPSQPFPAQPLFVLGAAYPNVYADPAQDVNFSASGYVKDGLTAANPTITPTLSVTGGQAPAESPTASQLPRYGFLTAVPKSDPQQTLTPVKADAKISPYLQLTVKNANYGYGEMYFAENAYPLLLALPDPFVRPDLGDVNGVENQFVYSNDQTAPLIQVPATISTGPNGGDPFPDDLAWLRNTGSFPRVTWKFDAVPSAFATSPTQFPLLDSSLNHNYTGSLTANSSGNLLPTTTDAHNKPVLNFLGLPESIYGLGNHTITLGVQGNPTGNNYVNSQTAYIQTFFPALQFNHPNQDSTPTPNWLYYYNQIFPATGSSDPANPVYNVNYVSGPGPSHTANGHIGSSDRSLSPIIIEDDAYTAANKPIGLRLFDIDPNVNSTTNTQTVRYAGILRLTSLLWYTAVARHEQGHVDTYVTPDGILKSDGSSAGNIFTGDNGPFNATANPNTSQDGDNISDGWELLHHMDPTRPDTTRGLANYSAQDPGSPDNQILADIPAAGAVFSNISLWNRDWSDTGVQFNSATLPYIADPYPTDSGHLPVSPDFGQKLSYPPKFYLIFDAAVAGKTGKFLAGHSYKITNLSDLTGEYPNLLTSLQDLSRPVIQ